MGRHHTNRQLTYWIEFEPKKATDAIVDAHRKSGGYRDDAAAQLGVSLRTLYRWIEKLGIGNLLDEQFGRYGGPPRKC